MSQSAVDVAHPVDLAAVKSIRSGRLHSAERVPRVGLFLFDCSDVVPLRETLERIPESVWEWLEEVVVVLEPPHDGDWINPADLSPSPERRVLVHRLPRKSGFGGARKAAFEQALQAGLTHIVVMRGDGSHSPESLPLLLEAIHVDPHRVVTASRFSGRSAAARTGMPPMRWFVHRIAAGIVNRILGLRLADYDTSYRLYSCRALQRVPFQLNGNTRSFDLQILIQLRALGVPVQEVEVRPAWREFVAGSTGVNHGLRSCCHAIDYRLHQLHLTRRGRYFVDQDVKYTLKLSSTGSHMQVVDAIESGSHVLDLGCSQGLLARPLLEKDVRVTGVDIGQAHHLADELEAYHQRDLDRPIELPVGREFDYVVISDVIEHLRNRRQLLRGARRYLKEGGRLIISTPNVALWFYRLSLLVGRFEYGPRGVLDETHVHLYTRATFRREVEAAGYRVVVERVTALPFEVVFRSTGRSRLISSVSRLYHGLARLWPELFAYQVILEAEITTLDEESTAS